MAQYILVILYIKTATIYMIFIVSPEGRYHLISGLDKRLATKVQTV